MKVYLMRFLKLLNQTSVTFDKLFITMEVKDDIYSVYEKFSDDNKNLPSVWFRALIVVFIFTSKINR